MTHTLEVYHENQLVFYSDNHWLHPLFELEQFLLKSTLDPSQLILKDKIIGRAAALLMVRLKISEVYGKQMSKPAEEVLKHFGIRYSYGEMLDKVACATENLLWNELNPAKAYDLILARIENKTKTGLSPANRL